MTIKPTQQLIHQKLRTGLWSHSRLLQAEKTLLRNTLRASRGRGFKDEQRQFFSNFYLELDGLEEIAEVLAPLNLGVNPRKTLDGLQVINADLLTDCLEPRDTWYSIRDWLVTMPIKYLMPEEFPVTESLDA